MKNFDKVIGDVLKNEGGYVDHPSDPGGATNMGITRRTLADWRNVVPYWNLPKQAVKDLTVDEAKKIYKARYWDAVKGDVLPSGLDYAVFDFGIHSGPATAVKHLQHLVGAKGDGLVGNETLSAVANKPLVATINAYMNERWEFLTGLGTFGVFGEGWKARIANVRAKALELAGEVEVERDDDKQNDQTPEDGSKNTWVTVLIVLAGLAMKLFTIFKKR